MSKSGRSRSADCQAVSHRHRSYPSCTQLSNESPKPALPHRRFLHQQRGEALPCGRAPPQLEESIGDTQRFQLFVGVACSFEVLGSPAVRGMRYADLVLVLREVRIPTLSANLLDAK